MQIRITQWSPVVLALLLGFVPGAFAQGNYEPVTAEDLVQARLNHYFTKANRPGRAGDFEWSFAPGRFTIKAGKSAIPPELQEQLLPDGKTAKVIEGEWAIEKGTLVLRKIKGDGVEGRETASLPVFRTAPTVIRIGQPQYVFAVEPKKKTPPAAEPPFREPQR